MFVVRFMVAQTFEEMGEIVRNQVKAHKHQQYRHGEAGEDFGALEAKRVSNAGALPHFKVAQHVDGHAQHGAQGIEEHQMRQGRLRQRPGRAPQGIYCHHCVAVAAPEPHILLGTHALAALERSGDGKRGRQGERRAGQGFLEDGVRHAAVLVLVSAALADGL